MLGGGDQFGRETPARLSDEKSGVGAWLVGKPDFYGGGLDALFMPDLRQALRETVLNLLDRAGGLSGMARTSRKFAIAHGAQFAAQCLPDDHDAEFLVNPLAEINDPPPHDAMNSRDRAALDDWAKAARWASFSRGACPGALRSIRPSGP